MSHIHDYRNANVVSSGGWSKGSVNMSAKIDSGSQWLPLKSKYSTWKSAIDTMTFLS
jgi:hypothetical protein